MSVAEDSTPAADAGSLASGTGTDQPVDQDELAGADQDAGQLAGPGGPRPGRFRPPGRVLTGAAALVLLVALLLPDEYGQLSPAGLLRVPIEAVLVIGLALLLPVRPARWLAVVAGALLGLVTLLKLLDLGFTSVFSRSFDLVHDWGFLLNGRDFLTELLGTVGGNLAGLLVALLPVALVVLMALAARRLVVALRRRRRGSGTVLAALGAAWGLLAVTGLQPGGGEPTRANAASVFVQHAARVPDGLHDKTTFAEEVANDPFQDTPGDQLLAGLRGKDVHLVFVESYGRVALENPAVSTGLLPVLRRSDAQLTAAGYSAASGWLSSPTAGGGSWLAHSTLQTGTWVENKARYATLLASSRTSLSSLFGRAGWRTLAVMPNVRRSWPEGAFYHFDQLYSFDELGYTGPKFGWAAMPDQYTFEAFRRLELTKDHPPLMTMFELGSSHSPWAPLPEKVDWEQAGDSAVYEGMPKRGERISQVWRDPKRVVDAYGRSLQYTISTMTDFVTRYGDDDTVVIFLGDHQPVPLVAGPRATADVPITIVARDPAVTARLSSWGWKPGLQPEKTGPVWAMSVFRDRFLSTFAAG